jgi:hypothetical protein
VGLSENVIIGFPDWTDDITWSGGSWETTYPVSNLGDDEMARVARSTDATNASTQFVATIASEEPTDLVGLVLPNATIEAQAQIILKDNGGNQVADSGKFDVFPASFPTDELLWEDERFWTGKYGSNELSGTLWTRPYQFDQTYLTKTVEVYIFDSSNADGYIDVAYAAVAQSWQFGLNPAIGAQFGFRGARTRSVQARGGAKSFDRLPKANTWQGTVEFMDRDEALTRKYELQRQFDIDKPFLWWPHPDEPRHWPRTVFIARNREVSRLRYVGGGLQFTEIPVNLEQVL